MTEQEKPNLNKHAEQSLISSVVTSGAIPDEDQALLELAQRLAAHDLRAQSQIEQPLLQTLLKRVSEKEKSLNSTGAKYLETISSRPLYQAVSVALALSAILILVSLTVQPIRALAKDIIRQIGNFAISSEPSDAEQYVATMTSGMPTAIPNPKWAGEEIIAGRLTTAQASAKAGFLVYEAAYLPEGYRFASRDVLTTGLSTTVDTSYRIELDPPLHDGQQMAGVIAIAQNLAEDGAPAWEKGTGEVPVVNLTVRGQPGVWLEQIPVIPFQNDQGEWDYARWNQLIWAEDGYTFMLQTNMPVDYLPLSEMLKTAESLKQ